MIELLCVVIASFLLSFIFHFEYVRRKIFRNLRVVRRNLFKKQRQSEREDFEKRYIKDFQKLKIQINLSRYQVEIRLLENIQKQLSSTIPASEREILNQRFANKFQKLLRTLTQKGKINSLNDFQSFNASPGEST